MKAGVIVFPGSNCDRDAAVAIEKVCGTKPTMVWHGDSHLPQLDLIVIPGGFSYGDYLRSGAMAGKSPVMREVIERAKQGTRVLGICNGFQVLTETGILPGALMRNASLKFVCRDVRLRAEQTDSPFTNTFEPNEEITIPVAHHDGNYFADEDTLDALEDNGQVAFRYHNDNPNGSQRDIAGIFNRRKTVLGMMPHPERVIGEELGGTDGVKIFESLVAAL
ncbi:MAG: phosphoribosylformylglycinamidine synthase subunit PurQ [Alphaproteobacteria bacterium]